jgi:hypothetical protein
MLFSSQTKDAIARAKKVNRMVNRKMELSDVGGGDVGEDGVQRVRSENVFITVD